jgi:hypothetical protein
MCSDRERNLGHLLHLIGALFDYFPLDGRPCRRTWYATGMECRLMISHCSVAAHQHLRRTGFGPVHTHRARPSKCFNWGQLKGTFRIC